MVRQQKTIEKEFRYEGVGLHTGKYVKTLFRPAPPNTGIVFRRVDLDTPVDVPAIIEYINKNEIKRNTTLTKDGVTIHTVEHVLAVASGLQVDNLIVEIDSDEPPEPEDGSVLALVEKFKEAGIKNQGVPAKFCKINSSVSYSNNGVEIVALPYDGFKVTFTIEFDNPHIGTQHATFEINPDTFVSEIAPARTFSLMEDVEKLRAEGLIKGGSLENAIVVDRDGIVNEGPLRFKNEFVRHKILDIIGDLSLVGAPIEGHIIAFRSGHRYNIEFASKLSEVLKNQEKTAMGIKGEFWDINVIQKIMPHRYPFLLVDRIVELEDKKRVVGIKNVTINEPFFIGHFPGHPIMPAVLIIEAMAQVGGILLLSSVDNPEKYLVYFIGIDKAKFRRPVVPGDQVRFELEMMMLKRRYCKMKGTAFVDDKIVAEAELTSTIVDR